MMHELLTECRQELIERCSAKVARRSAPRATEEEVENGIPLFLDQLIKTLQVEQTLEPTRSLLISGPSGGENPVMSEIGESAARHARELLQRGFTIEQLVHDYGDLCQAITDLAFERGTPFDVDEFRTLNRCLDNAIANAVTEFNYQRDLVGAEKQTYAFNERLGFFAHELRNLLNSATRALTAIKAGQVGLNGATGAVLDSSLVGLHNLVDRSLAEVRMTAGVPVQPRLFSLAHFIADVKLSATLEAEVAERGFSVSPVDPRLALEADRDLVFAAVGNLLQNAFKFSPPKTEVSLNAYGSADRILIEVEDQCGGLPAGDPEKMFESFTQGNEKTNGLGLGLSISRRSVEANQGILSVRDLPGSGCVFTIDLPRHPMPEPSFRM